jgi:hypothetical protein
MAIERSRGQTSTERYLSELCDRTFLKVWCYANPFKADRKELCDVIAVFENHVFLFFDRESRKFDGAGDIELTWQRWQREAVDKQINTARGAKRYVAQHPGEIYLDAKCTVKLPIAVSRDDVVIHKIIVAHGAKEACESFSDGNVYGSLAISYGDRTDGPSLPFMLWLEKDDPVHVLDSHNLEIVLSELDTFHDFSAYILEKERAIEHLSCLVYCGEEDLLAHYFANFDSATRRHFIGTPDPTVNGVAIGEGEWRDFSQSEPYRLRKAANEDSYLWDDVVQRTCQNALDGKLLGNGDVFNYRSAIHEMAKEPRLQRRVLSKAMIGAIQRFPEAGDGIMRNVSLMPSFFEGTGYVFLQLRHPNIVDYDGEYRPKRQKMLAIACGSAKNKFPHLKKIVGIAIDAPKYSKKNAEDFILLNCGDWSDEEREHYEKENEGFRFFGTDAMTKHQMIATEFPRPAAPQRPQKTGRNQACPCGSGKKYKSNCSPPVWVSQGT